MPGPEQPIVSANGAGRPGRKLMHRLLLHFSALLLFLFFFAAAVLVSLPKEPLRDYVVDVIHRQTGQRIDIDEISFTPGLSLEAKQLSWQPAVRNLPQVTVDRLSLAPQLFSLIGKNPACRFQAQVAGGTVKGRVDKGGNLDAVLAGVDLAPFSAFSRMFPVAGSIGGTIAADLKGGGGGGTADIDLLAEGLLLGGMENIGLPEKQVRFGSLRLRGKMTGQTLNVEELRNKGGDLSIAVNGTVLFNQQPARCRMNLRIELRPEARLAQSLNDLLQLAGLKAEADGSYRFRLSGSLAKPLLR